MKATPPHKYGANRDISMATRALATTVLFLTVAPAFADLQKGIEAFNSKDYKAAIEELKPLAELGDTQAEYYLGTIYGISGFESPRDIKRYRLLSSANRSGYQPAQTELSLMREQGRISFMFGAYQMTDAEIAAFEPLRELANKGDAGALTKLAVAYCDEMKLGKKDSQGRMSVGAYEEVPEWFRRASELGEPHAKFHLGLMYLGVRPYGYSSHLKQDVPMGMKLLREAADAGILTAQIALGSFLASDQIPGVELNPKEGFSWVRKAAEKNEPQAMLMIGSYYATGTGVEKDPKEAVNWYRKSAELGNAAAQFALASSYSNGYGVEKDEHEAYKLCLSAAQLGYQDAEFTVAAMYSNGLGTEKNNTQAAVWMKKAADSGNAEAAYYYSKMLAAGSGIPKNDTDSINWLEEAMRAGYGPAQYALGSKYANGQGVPKNTAIAFYLFGLAAAKNVPNAQKDKEAMSALIPPDDVQKLNDAIARWRPGMGIPHYK